MIRQIRAMPLLAVLVLVAGLTACASNPIEVAETPAQRAYALERSYNIVLANALDVVENATTPERMREGIRAVERRTTPVVDALSNAFAAYELARAEFQAGTSTEERLAIAAAELENWTAQAERALIELSTAMRARD